MNIDRIKNIFIKDMSTDTINQAVGIVDQLTRRDFIKLVEVVVPSFYAAIKMGKEASGEQASDGTLEVYSSRDNQNGFAIVNHLDTETLEIYSGQPTKYNDPIDNEESTALVNTNLISDPNFPITHVDHINEGKGLTFDKYEFSIAFIPELLMLKKDLTKIDLGSELAIAEQMMTEATDKTTEIGMGRLLIARKDGFVTGVNFEARVKDTRSENAFIKSQNVRLYPLELKPNPNAAITEYSNNTRRFYMRGRANNVIAANTESPLPEGAISELQKTLGENYKLTKDKEGEYFVINGIENLKFNADGTAEFVFEDRDLTVDFRTISVKDEALRIQRLQYKEGEWSRIIAGAPSPDMSEAELAEYVDNLPKQILVLNADGSISEWSNRLIGQIVMEKTATYDPLDEFKGVVVDGKEVELADLVPSLWIIDIPDNNAPISIGGGNNSYSARQIALNQGWSSLDVYDTDGNLLHKLINVPIVAIESDYSITVMSGLINQSKLSEILDLFTKEKRNTFEPEIISGEVTHPTTISQLFSDVKLREFMAIYNKPLLDLNILEEVMVKLPPELGTMVYFDFEQ